MKLRILTLAAVACMLAFGQLLSQEKMSKDQWQEEMTAKTAQRTELLAKVAALDKDLADMKAESARLDQDVTACEDALYALLGVTREEFNAYERDLAAMERRVAELQGMSDAQLVGYKDELTQLQGKAADMAKSKIALIPRIGDRVHAVQDKITALLNSLQREKTYTVGTWSRNRDCLWNIAKKTDTYANAWMWPKIWQGNRDKIKDPDLIKPKWVLKIPEGKELSKEEKKAADSYYRKKAAEPASPSGASN